jgi:hypothetical protein
MGWVFILDRVTGRPLFPVEERRCRRAKFRVKLLAHPTVSVEAASAGKANILESKSVT